MPQKPPPPSRTPAPHVQAAVARAAQAKLPERAPSPGRTPQRPLPAAPQNPPSQAAHVRRALTPAQAKLPEPVSQGRLPAAHVRDAVASVQTKPSVPAILAVRQRMTAEPATPAPGCRAPENRVIKAAQSKAVQPYVLERVDWESSDKATKARELRGGKMVGSAVGGRNIATVSVEGKLFTNTSQPPAKGVAPAHSEARVLNDIQDELKRGHKIDWVYTEREPCGTRSGHRHCDALLQNTLRQHGSKGDGTKVYYSFDYPDNESLRKLVDYYRSIGLTPADAEYMLEEAYHETAVAYGLKYKSGKWEHENS